jgi:hypothetical protein
MLDMYRLCAIKEDDMSKIKWWEEHPRLWEQLVPASGQADTVQGELIRCSGKLSDEAYRNGNMNWESGYERLARFLGAKLNDPVTFTPEERKKIADAVEEVIRDFKTPDVSGHGSSHYYLTEMTVRWCLANPKPLTHENDPTLEV